MLLARHLILFTKYPTPGLVKTRMAVQIGKQRAAAYYKEMVESVVDTVQTRDHGYTLTCYFDPPEQEDAFRQWLIQLAHFIPQCQGDLGMRMFAAVQDSCARGFHKTVVIGSDCVDLKREHIFAAFDSLDHHDVVFGPSEDGGYYLIGTKKAHAALFHGIAWSTETVLAQSLLKAKEAGLSLSLLPVLKDIDTL